MSVNAQNVKIVTQTVKTSIEATAVVDRLKAAGFTASDISVLMPDKQGSKDFAVDNQTKAPEGATVGAL